MESSAASGVICLQFSTAPQPKVNRLWDLSEKMSPFCRTYWTATGWGAWRDDEQEQADQVPVIPRVNKTASRSCVQTVGLKPPQPTPPVHYTPGRGQIQAQRPTQAEWGNSIASDWNCFRGSVAHGAVCLITHSFQAQQPTAPYKKKTKPANISN